MNWIKILIWIQIFVIVVLAKDQHKKPKYKYKGKYVNNVHIICIKVDQVFKNFFLNF